MTVYIAANILLAVIDLSTSPGKTWFFWPLFGWGIGIIGHATGVYLGAGKRSLPNN